MDLSSFAAAASIAQTASETIQALVHKARDARMKKDLLELHNLLHSLLVKLVEAQTQYQQLLEVVRELEKEQEQAEQWAQTETQYELHQLAPGAVVYVPKPAQGQAVPDHYLCPQCFHKRFKSILQFHEWASSGRRYRCNACGLVVTDTSDRPAFDYRSVPRKDPFPGF